MKIACIADTHGYLPEEIPECDVLVIAGDICPVTDHSIEYQLNWLRTVFKPWMHELRFGDGPTQVFYTPGNHDWCFEVHPHLSDVEAGAGTLLLGSSGKVVDPSRGDPILNVYGYPWTPAFCGWAFNSNTNSSRRHAEAIPEDTDVLITHGPPLTILDVPGGQSEHCGCKYLRDRVRSVRPKLHVFGHIHGSYGQTVIDGTTFVNASYVDEAYNPRGPESIQVVEV